MVKESINGQIREYILANGNEIKCMVMVLLVGLMEENT